MEEGRRSESEGSTLEEVNSGKEGLFRRKDRKVTQGKKDYSRLVE